MVFYQSFFLFIRKSLLLLKEKIPSMPMMEKATARYKKTEDMLSV